MGDSLLAALNAEQKKAVGAEPGHILVLAGAGSGKTRVLTSRIAWLIKNLGVSPYEVLAVTFTNKSAKEMQSRIEDVLGTPMKAMWVGTFHGLAHRMLRLHHQEAMLPQNFQIIDSDDQLRLIKRLYKTMALDDQKWPIKQTQVFINQQKEAGLRADAVSTGEDVGAYEGPILKVYSAYEQLCQQSGLVDFSELLLRVLELLQNNPALRAHYQQRFVHLLVDEFQDTNAIQYAWIRCLCGPRACVMAVGDDDQSIYSWRGARIENIHSFSRDFESVDVIRLEQNYRSTQNILAAANAVIAHNSSRMGKNLWSEQGEGLPVTVYAAFNGHDESHYIAGMVAANFAKGVAYQQIAVLYRSNAQSRVLEERLLEAQIPYKIYGGQKFFDRLEIKDALAYLRLLLNRFDDAAFERVVNVPARGIGQTTLMKLREAASQMAQPLWQTVIMWLDQGVLSTRACSALRQFVHLIDGMDEATSQMTLADQTAYVVKHSQLSQHYRKEPGAKSLVRIENLQELVTATQSFAPQDPQLPPLAEFLSHVTLDVGDRDQGDPQDCVHLMTLHAAKGLEFPVVFIAGMEEDLMPHKMSIHSGQGLEEERRLCYVGMTRAKQQLFLCYAQHRHLYGVERHSRPSRFIEEIPESLLHRVRPRAQVGRAQSGAVFSRQKLSVASIGPFPLGQQVVHPKFGLGAVISYEGSGAHMRVQVAFNEVGSKWLVLSYAHLVAA